MKNDFLKAIGGKPKYTYRAYMDRGNDVGVSPEFASKETTEMWVQDAKKTGAKFLSIKKTKNY